MKRIAALSLSIVISFVATEPGFETAAQETFKVHASTQDPKVLVAPAQIERWESELSNWGRWGPRDQRGTLNLITPEKTRQAARLVTDGVTVSLGHFVSEEKAIDRMGPGYVTRGILVDMPLLQGVDWLAPSKPIYVSDLEQWEKFAGVTVGSGDVLLVRTGRWAKREQAGPWNYARGGAGLHASVLPWLHERGVAVLVGDAVNDVQPSGVEGLNRPIHQLTQVFMGLPLVDNGYLEDVAREAGERRRWEFMVSWQITQVPGGTAGPFNAIATF